jgi:phosphohistidine phosphatase
LSDFELLLIRHGVAEEWAPGGDAERSLTEDGMLQIEASSVGLLSLGLHIDLAICSPFLRARQTAEVHCARLGGTLDSWAGLTPSSPASATRDEILQRGRSLAPDRRMAVFGHNPNITSVLSLLVAGHGASMFNVRPGDVAHLLIPSSMPFVRGENPPHAIVLGFYPCTTLERLGASLN